MFTTLSPRQSRGIWLRRHWTLALALFPAVLTVAAQAESALSLEEALLLAQDRSRQLAGHDAAAQASRQMAIAAGQRPDPALKAGVNNLPINGADRFSLTRDFMTMRSVGVMQEFTRLDKLKARTARFDREGDVAEAARLVTLTDLRRETAKAWLDRHYQERMRAKVQWLAIAGILPLVLSILPCVAMCALGLCMMKGGNGKSFFTQEGDGGTVAAKPGSSNW